MITLLGWIFRLIGAFLGVMLVVAIKSGDDMGWVSPSARYFTYGLLFVVALFVFGIGEGILNKIKKQRLGVEMQPVLAVHVRQNFGGHEDQSP